MSQTYFAPRYIVTPRILRQLKAIERTCGFLSAVALRPDWQRKVRARTHVHEALASVQIEGNSLTIEAAFALADELPQRELRDSEREFCNYLQSFDAIDALCGDRDAVIARGDLLNLQRGIVSGVRGGQRSAGEFRREDVRVGDVIDGRTIVHHRPIAWARVPTEVEALLHWIEAGKQKGKGLSDPWVHPAIQAGIAQHRLAWIHPFVDGNGRTARMFTTMLLYQRGYDFKYLFELSKYYNDDRKAYYGALRTADRSGDYTGWLEYFLGGFANQMMRIEDEARKAASE